MFNLKREDLINYVKEIIEFISLIRKKMDFSKKITDFEINDFETVQKLKNFINMSYAYGERTVSKNTDIFPIIKAKSTDGFDLELTTNVLTIELKDEIIQMYKNSHLSKHDEYIHIRIVKCVEEKSCDITLITSDDQKEKRECYWMNLKDAKSGLIFPPR